jgi:hypothetical protein
MANSSGTFSFQPAISDLLLESFDRIQMRPAELTTHHLSSATRSANLILQAWSNRGVNLFEVVQNTIPLVQGITTYSIPSNTVMLLDLYVRQYAMNGPTNITLPAFSTQINSPNVTVTYANNGLSVGNYINVVIPVSVGGLILYGFYQCTSVTSTNTFVINAGSNASSTVSSGGAIPFFTVTANSTTVSVNLPNHGYVAGQTFVVQVSTTLGGLQLYGTYTVLAVTDANDFTFTAAYAAGFSASGAENGGQAQIALQQVNQQPADRIIMPISRTDYASLPDKLQQGFPTVYWFDRLLNPTCTIWQVPDGNGPYALIYYAMTQIQDAAATLGQVLNIPTRFLEAFCCEMAYHLARKWKPELEAARKADAIAMWSEAAAEDRERVSLYLQPMFDGYYN